MRKYGNKMENKLEEVFCNCCGKKLHVENGFAKEGCFHVEYSFGYFSKKDGMKHVWDMCEECYDTMMEKFAIPPEITEDSELL